MNKDERVTFEDLSLALKTQIVINWIIIGIFTLSFIVSFATS